MSEVEATVGADPDAVDPDAAAQEPPRPAGPVAVAVLALLTAVPFGYLEFRAVSNLVALPANYAALGIPEAVPWPLLILGLVLPAALYLGALLLGRRRPALDRLLLLLAGLGAASATSISLVVLAGMLFPA